MTMSDRTDKERKLEEDAAQENVKMRYLSEYPSAQRSKMSDIDRREKATVSPILAKKFRLLVTQKDLHVDVSRSPTPGNLSHSNISPTVERNEQPSNTDKRKLENVCSYYETNEWLRVNYPHFNRQCLHPLSHSSEDLSAMSKENEPTVVNEDSDEEFIDVVTCDPDQNQVDESSVIDKHSESLITNKGDKIALTSNECRFTSKIRISSHDSGFISDEDTRLRLKVHSAQHTSREHKYFGSKQGVKQVRVSEHSSAIAPYGTKYKRGDDSPKNPLDDADEEARQTQFLEREPTHSASPPLSSSDILARVRKSASPQLRPTDDSLIVRTESDSPKSIANRASPLTTHSNPSGEDADSDVSERCRQGSACSDQSETSRESPYLITNSESSSYAAAKRMILHFGPKLQSIARIIPSEQSAFTKSDYYINRWYRNAETNIRKDQWEVVRKSPERKLSSPDKLNKVNLSCSRDIIEDKPKYVPYRIPAVSRATLDLRNRISTNQVPEDYVYHNDSDLRNVSRFQQPCISSNNHIGTVNGIRLINQFDYQLSGSSINTNARKNYTAFPDLKRHYARSPTPGESEAADRRYPNQRVQLVMQSRGKEEELPHVSGSRAWESIYRSGEEARPGSEGEGEGEGEDEDSEDADDAALRLRVSVLLWALLGEARLRELGWPSEPERRVLWRAVDVCCSVAGAKSAAAVPLPQDHDCGDDMACFRDHAHRFLEVCAPTRDLWKRFGWASLTVDAVVAKIYKEGEYSRMSGMMYFQLFIKGGNIKIKHLPFLTEADLLKWSFTN